MDEYRQDRPDPTTDAPSGAFMGAATGPFSGLADTAAKRNLLIIIVTMPLVFLIVVMATIAMFGSPAERQADAAEDLLAQPAQHVAALDQPASAGSRATIAPTPASASGAALAPLVLPSGATIGAMALDGDRLALRVEDENGGEIVIYDLALGATVQRIAITPQQTVSEDDGL